jgi:hypothetical protein
MARKKKRKRFIDGIYNYCDRWCERCPFTERCRVYDMERQVMADEESRDPNNAAFWQALSGIFEKTKDMLRTAAAEHGIDIDSLDLEAEGARQRRRDRRIRSNTLSRQSEQYARLVQKWFKEHESLLEEYEETLSSRLHIELPGDDPQSEAVALTDAAEVVRWYQFQIAAKLGRALDQDDDEEEEDLDDEWRAAQEQDRDGSAKVALIGIDRSLAAWTVLRQSLADEADSILDILLRLARLRDAAERAFPNARAFLRPGFDAPLEA